MSVSPRISLIIPVYNESRTIEDLIDTIQDQTLPPDEIILVDGGSTDDTVALINRKTHSDPRYRIIEAGKAYPGKGRNIGAMASSYGWIAFTDAGIRLDKNWLMELAAARDKNPGISVVYGNCLTQKNNLFEKCASIAYLSPLKNGFIRMKSIASSLLTKEAWTAVGGFPDWRAAEDLFFMEQVAKKGFECCEAPEAKIYWKLQSDFSTTFNRFRSYSKYNVWAGRQNDWHYGVLRQYVVMIGFLLSSFILHPAIALLIPAWMIVRALKRGYSHRHEFGKKAFTDPRFVFLVAGITIVTDLATFWGWVYALLTPNPLVAKSLSTSS